MMKRNDDIEHYRMILMDDEDILFVLGDPIEIIPPRDTEDKDGK